MKKIVSLALVLMTLFCLTQPVLAAKDYTLSEEIMGIQMETVAAEKLQDWLDGDLTENVGDGREWYVFAMLNAQYNISYDKYRTALESFVQTKTPSSPVTREKLALLLHGMGSKIDFIQKVANEDIGQLGLMSYVFGLHLLNNGITSEHFTKQQVIEEILNRMHGDYSWSVMGDSGDVDTTAMVVQALAPAMADDSDLQMTVNAALLWIASQQYTNGAYASMGDVNAESCAQVAMALVAAGRDYETDAPFLRYKVNVRAAMLYFVNKDGSVAHVINGEGKASTAAQVCLGLNAQEQKHNPFLMRPKQNKVSTRQIVLILAVLFFLIVCGVMLLEKKKGKFFVSAAAVFVVVLVVLATVRITPTKAYYGTEEPLPEKTIATTITIRCDKVAGRESYLPTDGVILKETEVVLPEGATAADQLIAAARKNEISLDMNGASSTSYIAGIQYLYEFAYGDLSGWLFCVNGQFSGIGCGEVTLHDGDTVEWVYTLDMGHDVGNTFGG